MRKVKNVKCLFFMNIAILGLLTSCKKIEQEENIVTSSTVTTQMALEATTILDDITESEKTGTKSQTESAREETETVMECEQKETESVTESGQEKAETMIESEQLQSESKELETTTFLQQETTFPIFTVTDFNSVMYAIQAVNVRRGPSTQYEKIGSLSQNQEIVVTGKTDTGWYRISYKNTEAYVSGKYLTTEKAVETMIETTAELTSMKQQETESETKQEILLETTIPKDEKKEQARVVAEKVADYILADINLQTDIDRVYAAASVVSQYCANAVYTTEGKDYCEAYGVFISGEFSCAGATRALGMVLTCMGYEWEHINENQWTHQWCRVIMDGQTGWADGQIGYAGYGSHPVE